MHISFYRRPLFLLLVFYAACIALFLEMPKIPAYIPTPPEAEIEAVIISYPQVKNKKTSFTAKVLQVNGITAKFKTYINCADCGPLLRGQTISARGELAPIKEAVNFGSFNWAKFMARKKIFTRIDINSAEITGVYSRFWVTLSKVRNSILDVFQNNFDSDLSAIASGITIGEKGDISRGLYAAFQDSGAMHLLVASGGNVGFVTLIVYFICSLFGAGRRTSAALALLLAAFYTLIAGADAPLLRAYIMTLFGTIGFLLGRKSGVLQGFITAAFIILIINPHSLFEAGFQMSFLATLGIILLVSNFKINLSRRYIVKSVLKLFFVSLIAQLMLLPVFTNYFYKVSLTAAVSNIILVPLSGLIMGLGFFTWLASLLPFGLLFKASLYVLEFLLVIFKIFVEFFAGFGLSKITASAMKPTSIIAYYIVLLGFLNLPVIKRKFLYAASCLFLVFVLLFAGLFINRGGVHVLEGRYNKAFLVKEGRKVKVIGAGIQGDILRRAVLASGVKKIDCLFLNAGGKSASYGLQDIEGIKIKNIYLPEGSAAAETVERIKNSKAAFAPIAPGDEYCGVKAELPWYISKDGAVFMRSYAGGNLSYIYNNYFTAANMKDIMTGDEFYRRPVKNKED